MEIQTFGEAEFRALGRRLAKTAESKALRRNLTKSLRSTMDPAVQATKQAVMNVQSHGVSGGGTRRRTEIHAQRRKRSARGGHGLRASIARGVRSRVKYTGNTVGLRIYVDPATLPASQRKLPRYLDSDKGWRHPVFGNREVWVRQTGQPWFRSTLRQYTPRLRNAVAAAAAETMKELK